MESRVFDALKANYGDQHGLTFVRDTPVDEVLTRLGVPDDSPRVFCTAGEALETFSHHPDEPQPAVQLDTHGSWTHVFEIDPEGMLFKPDVVARLSRGTDVVASWHLLSGTIRAAHARNGIVLGTYDDWMFERPAGPDPRQLDQALVDAGFFSPEADEAVDRAEWDPSMMVLAALERGFDLSLPADFPHQQRLTVAYPERR